ncbi:MAG: glucoamylase family protein [Bacteroidota bacterium]
MPDDATLVPDGPTVANVFKPAQLAEYARRLARDQALVEEKRVSKPLRPLLRSAYRDLTDAYRALAGAGAEREVVTPAAEWLLDNFHIVRDQVRDIEDNLPKSYYKLLPKLRTGPFTGMPRVFELVHTLASHTDNTLDQENLTAFTRAFQEVDLLTLAELWALPIMLRLVLVEKVVALTVQIIEARQERRAASRWARRIAQRGDEDPSEVVGILAEMAREHSPLSGPFVTTFSSRLQAQGPSAVPALEWLEQRLRSRRATLEDVARRVTQRETQWQVSMANAILSLRHTGETDWGDFVEDLSAVEDTLRGDPDAVYPKMDPGTRDLYRHRVETLSRHASETEFGVAERAVALAASAKEAGEPDPAGHVGYWLIGPGQRALGKEVGFRAPLRERLVRIAHRHPTAVYLGFITVVTLLALAGVLWIALGAGAGPGLLGLTAAAAFLPLLDFAVTFANFNAARLLPPSQLARMDFSDGIPEGNMAFVVIPTLLSSPENARAQVEALEVHAAANPDPALRFALLTDFRDAEAQHAPGDDAIVEAAVHAVRALNARTGRAGGDGAPGTDTFFLLHRERRWNERQGVWMGWERKRGKLEEFNDLLRTPPDKWADAETTYTVIEGDFRETVQGDAVRYVVTLDADTRLPPDGAVDLIATAAHPVNVPRYSAETGRVVEGYGILQPRVSVVPEGSLRSPFSRIYSGNIGVDPYTTAVSDAYQDLFGEGIYTGKGLYDVDAFRRTLAGSVPENAVLSHDLLEGNHARAALVTDIEVFDDYPSRYSTFAMRLHRWVRGDWQLLPWLMPRVRDARGRWRRTPLSVVGRWKIFDNMRRSLTPVALVLFLALAWTSVLPGSPFVWTAIALLVLAFPIYAPFIDAFFRQPADTVSSSYFRHAWEDLKLNALQTGLSVVFLAHQAVVMLDAVGRTLWRLFISRKNRLEWVTAYQAEQGARDIPRSLWLSVAVGVAVLVLISIAEPISWLAALPFAVAWIAAPWVAKAVSAPTRPERYRLTFDDTRRLRTLARRTWRYFDEFLSDDDRWLVPDNFQVKPAQGLARRTSPTNIGLALNAVQVARDFGYLPRQEEVRRLGAMLSAVEGLEKHRGHLYNWYATETGAVMHPRYVSTVDSGNLAGSLVVVKQGLGEVAGAAWPSPALAEGVRDALCALDETLRRCPPDDFDAAEIVAVRERLGAALDRPTPATLTEWRDRLDALLAAAADLHTAAQFEPSPVWRDQDVDELRTWAGQPLAQLRLARSELLSLAPWLEDRDVVDDDLNQVSTLGALFDRTTALLTDSDRAMDTERLRASADAVGALLHDARDLAARAGALLRGMDFAMLYNAERDLFSIGYDVDRGSFDDSTYDLLASEARLASYLAIGKGEVPPEHWFRLSRSTRSTRGRKTLLSWSGTMFEYLMPLLFMRTYPRTLLDETLYNAVSTQRFYGRSKGRPWGISESAYYTLDLHLTYQYRAFGVPWLGLKRGLGEDYVLAPYATVLALMVRPDRALSNLGKIDELGAYGPYGYYEAVDFTPARVATPGETASEETFQVVRSYFAHHQGMSLLSLANVLLDNRVQDRFHCEPFVQSGELLLQERVPRVVEKIDAAPFDEGELEPVEVQPVASYVEHLTGDALADPVPRGVLLSNGRYTAYLTSAGSGYARQGEMGVTRWQPDRTHDAQGFFVYVRDLESNRFWSAGQQPVQSALPPDRYETWFHANKVETARVDDWIETFTEIVVSPEDDVEVRRVTLTNYSDQPRVIELTSYAEVVLFPPVADAAHPAFSKLFVETEYVPEHNAIIATRRPRKEGEHRPWLVHTVADKALGPVFEELQFETDRAKFIGRGRTLDHPAAMDPSTRLSGTDGAVLDPVVSLRRVVVLMPKENVTVTFSLGTADSREDAERLVERYDHPYAAQRALELASVYGLVELKHLGLPGERALYFQRLASHMLYGGAALRAPEDVLLRNRRPQSGLWAHGISGDLPILVYRIAKADDMPHFRLLLKAHEYWRLRGLETDLVILNDHPPSYASELQNAILQAIQTSPQRGLLNQRGGLFVRRTDQLADEDQTLILTVARVVINGQLPQFDAEDDEPSEAVQVAENGQAERVYRPTLDSALTVEADSLPRPAGETAREADAEKHADDLQFFNGYGGFSADGTEYVVRQHSRAGRGLDRTPLPWINVVANENAGFTASESGEGYTWSVNSQQNKLTPWSNDPVMDPAGEAFYLRDETPTDQGSGVFWSPTPRPVPDGEPYETRHGWGYTSYHHASHGIEQEVCLFVPREDPVKIARLRLTNTRSTKRKLTVFRYHEWVLGERRPPNAPYVTTHHDEETGALLARNYYNGTFARRVAFAAAHGAPVAGFTSDRSTFLGRGGSTVLPAALETDAPLDGTVGAGLDPCAAFQVPVEVEPGETVELRFLIGQAEHSHAARTIVKRYATAEAVQDALDEVTAFWRELLSATHVETPAPEIDVLANGWLLYQNLACRFWGRSAFYQSGGAFGYRDQLQDSTALIYTRPDLTRQQIRRNAAHQFTEGDVLHWWHPITEAGIRSRFSDDLLWLPYAVAFYVRTTGDASILDEVEPFLTARQLEEGEDEAFLTPGVADETGTVFEHAARTIDRSLTKGEHGLPLMGSGDWNDGMNRVGNDGTGESVWLGFFLAHILKGFIPLCDERGETERAERYRAYLKDLEVALNDTGWDGAWFRRAYYDEGVPLGSAQNDECRIDAIAQGWSIISGVATPEHAEQALRSVEEHLVDEEAGIIRLLTPPFDKTEHDPGYIKGYLPGVRENGGQYTHGVLWAIRAFAEQGHGAKATDLLRMISPVNHARTREKADHYKTEPYAIAADVYSVHPHEGRGGWTWYTGSAGWTYRVAVESVLGLKVEADAIWLDPRIPADWPGFKISYRLPSDKTTYVFTVENQGVEHGVVAVDGANGAVVEGAARVPRVDDGGTHNVKVTLGGTGAATNGAQAATEPSSVSDDSPEQP